MTTCDEYPALHTSPLLSSSPSACALASVVHPLPSPDASQARELKSVHVNVPGSMLRLVIHKAHVNKLNIYNQV